MDRRHGDVTEFMPPGPGVARFHGLPVEVGEHAPLPRLGPLVERPVPLHLREKPGHLAVAVGVAVPVDPDRRHLLGSDPGPLEAELDGLQGIDPVGVLLPGEAFLLGIGQDLAVPDRRGGRIEMALEDTEIDGSSHCRGLYAFPA
jgi:hypothetical protein